MSDAKRFTVYFDGTGNNKDFNTPEGTQTNVARLYELDAAKGTNLAQNAGHTQVRSLNSSASIGEAGQCGRKASSGLIIDIDEHYILQKVGQTDQFVIHDRRDVDPGRNFPVGKSTAIVNEKGIGEVARNATPKLELDLGLPQAIRR